MENFLLIVASITAGVSIAMGLVSIFAGLHKDGEKVDIVFGCICLSIFIYFLLPPQGFILVDKAPYSFEIDIKRFFSCANYALLPWFINLYSGYKKRLIPFVINAFILAAYITMVFTKVDSDLPVWMLLMFVVLGLILSFGFYTASQQIKGGDKDKGRWVLFAMIVFAFLCLLGIFYQLDRNAFGGLIHSKIFFPINLFPLPFMLIMGIRLRDNIFQKFRLEKIIHLRDKQRQAIMERVELIIVELDAAGNIQYINPFGLKLLGYSLNELVSKNWFDHLLPAYDSIPVKSIFLKAVAEQHVVPHFKNTIITRDGMQRTVNWTSEFVYDDNGSVKGSFSLGTDVTNEERAYHEIEQLKSELEKENFMLRGEGVPEWMNEEIIGQSEAIALTIQKTKQVARTDASVLLEGETGVGKELFAELIHNTSSRNKNHFIKINCGALPTELIESELFGHEKGAFTGAYQLRMGRFEMADKGTVFLDEVGELPLALQPKLLRVLQSGEFERVGGQKTIKVDVRIISATNRDLKKEVQSGKFREDLYYRLNVFPITVPPLRDRRDDIPLLVQFYVNRKGIEHEKEMLNISKADINKLCNYDWPGNVRELKNVIERSVISSDTDTLKLDWFYNVIEETRGSASLEKIEKEHILKILEECDWKINGIDGAASKLGMHPSTLRSRMKKLNISRPSSKKV